MPKQNRYLEAFKEPGNVIGLGLLGALSAATLNPLPLLVGLGIEALYLLFVPDTKWFLNRLDARYDAEVRERRQRLKEEVWHQVTAETKLRFNRLEGVREAIGGKTVEGKKWYREVLRRLDYLLEKYLLLAVKQGQFESYLRGIYNEDKSPAVKPPRAQNRKGNRGHEDDEVDLGVRLVDDEDVRHVIDQVQSRYDRQIEDLVQQATVETNLHNQAVFDKRREVLTRRREYAGRIGESLINIRHQLDLMEDTFGLIHDEIRALSPEQVLADVEDVVAKTETLSDRLQEISPFDLVAHEDGAERVFELEQR